MGQGGKQQQKAYDSSWGEEKQHLKVSLIKGQLTKLITTLEIFKVRGKTLKIITRYKALTPPLPRNIFRNI